MCKDVVVSIFALTVSPNIFQTILLFLFEYYKQEAEDNEAINVICIRNAVVYRIFQIKSEIAMYHCMEL